MAIPARQALRVASYIIKHKIKGTKHYPWCSCLSPPSAAIWPVQAAERCSIRPTFSRGSLR